MPTLEKKHMFTSQQTYNKVKLQKILRSVMLQAKQTRNTMGCEKTWVRFRFDFAKRPGSVHNFGWRGRHEQHLLHLQMPQITVGLGLEASELFPVSASLRLLHYRPFVTICAFFLTSLPTDVSNYINGTFAIQRNQFNCETDVKCL